jgi:filamentous hemagglutinin family protein
MLLATSVLALAAGTASAQAPDGGRVIAGRATIESGAARTVVRQSSGRAIIDWRGFDVGRDHSVRFDQPGARAVTLNRVESGRVSTIAGSISAPGTVMIQNGAGVLFTGDARIDVGGLVATSGRVDAARFQSQGTVSIWGGEAGAGRVSNQGTITVGEAGLAALVGREVENSGTIVARSGTVALASGTHTTLDLAGDGMLRVTVPGEGGRVSTTGTIDAGEGRVLLSAPAAAGALDGAINTAGLVRARGGISVTGGGSVRIGGTLDASGAHTVPAGAGRCRGRRTSPWRPPPRSRRTAARDAADAWCCGATATPGWTAASARRATPGPASSRRPAPSGSPSARARR